MSPVRPPVPRRYGRGDCLQLQQLLQGGRQQRGILAVSEGNKLQPDTLEPLQRTVKREDVSFFTINRAPDDDISYLPSLVTLPGIVAPGLLHVSVNMLSSAQKNFLAQKTFQARNCEEPTHGPAPSRRPVSLQGFLMHCDRPRSQESSRHERPVGCR
jgi:hypothetical protein